MLIASKPPAVSTVIRYRCGFRHVLPGELELYPCRRSVDRLTCLAVRHGRFLSKCRFAYFAPESP